MKIPIPAGDGLTKDTAFFFLEAKSNLDGVAMAYAYMESLGSEYKQLKQYQHIDSTDEEIIEWWETPVGKFWFRYRV
jgi:hypothetical protein